MKSTASDANIISCYHSHAKHISNILLTLRSFFYLAQLLSVIFISIDKWRHTVLYLFSLWLLAREMLFLRVMESEKYQHVREISQPGENVCKSNQHAWTCRQTCMLIQTCAQNHIFQSKQTLAHVLKNSEPFILGALGALEDPRSYKS